MSFTNNSYLIHLNTSRYVFTPAFNAMRRVTLGHHPLNVFPLGNAFLDADASRRRNGGLGELQRLGDDGVVQLLRWLETTSLGYCCQCSCFLEKKNIRKLNADRRTIWTNLVDYNNFMVGGSWSSVGAAHVKRFAASFDILKVGSYICRRRWFSMVQPKSSMTEQKIIIRSFR